MPRRSHRYTAAEQRELVERQQHSGLSAAAFCRQHALVYQTFVGWRRRFGADGRPDTMAATPSSVPASALVPEFVELGVAASVADVPSAASTGEWLVELTSSAPLSTRH